MPKPTVDATITFLDAEIAALRDSITQVERQRDALRNIVLGAVSVNTSQLQKQHIGGAIAHLEGWLVVQRFRLIDREEQARKTAVQLGVALGQQAARDVMHPPQAPYTHIGVDPGAAKGDYEGTHPLTAPSGE